MAEVGNFAGADYSAAPIAELHDLAALVGALIAQVHVFAAPQSFALLVEQDFVVLELILPDVVLILLICFLLLAVQAKSHDYCLASRSDFLIGPFPFRTILEGRRVLVGHHRHHRHHHLAAC